MATIMRSPVVKAPGAMPHVAGRYGMPTINAAARFSTYRATATLKSSPQTRPLLRPTKMARYYIRTTAPYSSAGAVVVGGGPGGLTMVGNMLENQDKLPRRDVVWVDPEFNGGRVNARYREVPSNTKVNLFVQFAEAVSPFRQVLETYPEPNAITALRALPQDQGCQLSHAADMCLMLTDGLSRNPDVVQHREKVVSAVLNKETSKWTVTLSNTPEPIETTHLILCPGASPVSAPLPILQKLPPNQRPETIDLDTALAPSILSSALSSPSSSSPSSDPVTVAVVGASHSAILVLMNLYALSQQEGNNNIRIKWFTRNKLRYAEYMPEGWILRDNTGLKGQAATWARENLDEDSFPTSPVSQVIEKVWTPPDDAAESERRYLGELPGCTHVVQAVGYKRDAGPRLEVVVVVEEEEGGGGGGKKSSRGLDVEYDSLSGRFFEKEGGEGGGGGGEGEKRVLPGLFGAGIAFPEKVTDPKGNVEHAVGFWKFMRFAKRVVPEWVAKP